VEAFGLRAQRNSFRPKIKMFPHAMVAVWTKEGESCNVLRKLSQIEYKSHMINRHGVGLTKSYHESLVLLL